MFNSLKDSADYFQWKYIANLKPVWPVVKVTPLFYREDI